MRRRKFLQLGADAMLAGAIIPILGGSRGGTGQDPAGLAPGLAHALSGSDAFAADTPPPPLLAVAHGPSPAVLTRAAVAALGGMGRFVHRGDRVVVKPNIGWDRTPEQAADTNPEVVAEVVRLCLDAGAKSVLVMDNPCNDPRRCYLRSGIAEAAKAAGARVDFFEEDRVRKMAIKGDRIKEWEVHPAIMEADVRINVPIAKQHSLSGLTLGMKNWLGALGGPRNRLHQEMSASIVDLAAFFKPSLTIIDGVRILTANGPSGGDLKDVRKPDLVIASADPVAAEARGAQLFDKKPSELRQIALAEQRGLGRSSWQVNEERRIETPEP